jgi:antitoxin FitA
VSKPGILALLAEADFIDYIDCTVFPMAGITIHNLDEALKHKLRLRAAQRDRSMEDEVRDILRIALAEGETSPGNLADAMRRRLEPLGGVELDLPPRGPMRAPPDFK